MGLGLGGLAMLLVFWWVAKKSRNVGNSAVNYIAEIMKQSEGVRKALGEELETAKETITKQRDYIDSLQRSNNALHESNIKLQEAMSVYAMDTGLLRLEVARLKQLIESKNLG